MSRELNNFEHIETGRVITYDQWMALTWIDRNDYKMVSFPNSMNYGGPHMKKNQAPSKKRGSRGKKKKSNQTTLFTIDEQTHVDVMPSASKSKSEIINSFINA